jgi:hypothetical protein
MSNNQILPHADHRDIALQDQAGEIVALEAALAELQSCCNSYRVVAHTALEQLATATKTNRRLQETVVRLHEMLREQRALDNERRAA